MKKISFYNLGEERNLIWISFYSLDAGPWGHLFINLLFTNCATLEPKPIDFHLISLYFHSKLTVNPAKFDYIVQLID